MRGKVWGGGEERNQERITPAYAGKSHILKEWTRTNEDHPRLCGEKPLFTRAFQHVKGSPPPMRGKANFSDVRTVPRRITPAYAGKRSQFENLGNTE